MSGTPWTVQDARPAGWVLAPKDGPRIGICDNGQEAHARRAVECVNALAGVEDPAATLASIAGFLEDVARGCDPDEARTIAADLLALLGGAL